MHNKDNHALVRRALTHEKNKAKYLTPWKQKMKIKRILLMGGLLTALISNPFALTSSYAKDKDKEGDAEKENEK